MDNREVIAEALRAFGEAIRRDWSDIDGRSIRYHMDELALILEQDTPVELEKVLFDLGVRKDEDGRYEWDLDY